MYWPLGAPRIYAATKKRRKPDSDDIEDDSEAESKDRLYAPIIGVRVSRTGHLLTTITEDTLTVWQASVCYG